MSDATSAPGTQPAEKQRTRAERGISKWDVQPEPAQPPPPPPLPAPEPVMALQAFPNAASGPAVVLPPTWGGASSQPPVQVIGMASPVSMNQLTPQAAQVLALSPGLAQASPARPGSSHIQAEEGDWPCPQCQNVNFRRRPQCNRCGAPRPEGYGGPRQSKGEGKSKGKGSKGPTLNLYITGLPITFDADQMKEFFGKWGEVFTAKVLQVKEGKTQAAGFVRMAEKEGRWVVENLCGSQNGQSPPGLPNPINISIIPDKDKMSNGEAGSCANPEHVLAETAQKLQLGEQLQWGTIRCYDADRKCGFIASPQMEVPCPHHILEQAGSGPGDSVMFFLTNEGNSQQASAPLIRLAAESTDENPQFALKGWYKGICVADKGFGFIESQDLKIVFGKDVYVNKTMAGAAKQGWVAFNAKLQRDAKDGSLLPMCAKLQNCDESWSPTPGDLSQSRTVEIPAFVNPKPDGKGASKKGWQAFAKGFDYGASLKGGKGGDFDGGSFKGGDFNGDDFKGGCFKGGDSDGGSFKGGDFNEGSFNRSSFKGGDFNGGSFKGGDFQAGGFDGGTFKGGDFKGGSFKGSDLQAGNSDGGKGGYFQGGDSDGGSFKGGDFKGGSFKGGDFQGVDSDGGSFKGGYFQGGDSDAGSFKGGDFNRSSFKGGDCDGGSFKGGDFKGGDFDRGSFKGGYCREGSFKGGDFQAGDSDGGSFKGGYFRQGDSDRGSFNGGDFRGGDSDAGSFKGGDSQGGDFNGGSFKGGDSKGGDFNRSSFKGVDFDGGSFKGGDFKGGDSDRGSFKGGDFKGGDINRSSFKGCGLDGGNFKGGDFNGGDVSGGNLAISNAQGGDLHGDNFEGGGFTSDFTPDFKGGNLKGSGFDGGSLKGSDSKGGDKGYGKWSVSDGGTAWGNTSPNRWNAGWSDDSWNAGTDSWGWDSWAATPAMKGKGNGMDTGKGKGAWQSWNSDWNSSYDSSWDWGSQSMGTKRSLSESGNDTGFPEAKMQKGGGKLASY